MTDVAEKDVNIYQQHDRAWSQITNRTQIFDKQNQQTKMLETITLD